MPPLSSARFGKDGDVLPFRETQTAHWRDCVRPIRVDPDFGNLGLGCVDGVQGSFDRSEAKVKHCLGLLSMTGFKHAEPENAITF
jgi:hypothetical protein